MRIARHAFRGELAPVLLWDVAYILGLSALLLTRTRQVARRRLTS